MGKRIIIDNRRPPDSNVSKNKLGIRPEIQEITLPPEIVRSREELDSMIAALEVFIQITETGLILEGRDYEADAALLPSVRTLLGRF